MSRYFPIAMAVAAIVSLTVVQSLISDRFVDTNVTAEQRAKLLADVPKEINDWKGEDLPVTAEVRGTAGAVGCVSRLYTNQRTNEQVKLWLIVGHARAISAHTPDVCFKGAGFSMRSPSNSLYTFSYPQQKNEAKFWTNTFTKEDTQGRQLERVFWAWYKPVPNEPVVWRAEEYPRYVFGNTRALFKMYFSSTMGAVDETTDQSAAMKFGKEFLPVIERILSTSDIHAPEEGADAAAAPAA
jgi:hypothetical protein